MGCLLTMEPCDDSVNYRRRHAEMACDGASTHRPGRDHALHGCDLLISERTHAAAVPSPETRQVAATLACHVGEIVLHRAEKQMVRSYATPIVAMMTDTHRRVGDCAIPVLPTNPVTSGCSSYAIADDAYLAVSVVYEPSPLPAPVTDKDLIPEFVHIHNGRITQNRCYCVV